MEAVETWVPVKEAPEFEINNFGTIRNRITKKARVPYDNNGYLRVYLNGRKRVIAGRFYKIEKRAYIFWPSLFYGQTRFFRPDGRFRGRKWAEIFAGLPGFLMFSAHFPGFFF